MSPEVLKPLIDRLKRNHDSLIIISSEIEWEVISFLLSQKLNGEIKVVAVTAPGIGNQQVNILEEIAKITGTKPIYTQELKGIEKINYSYLGHCEKAVVTREQTLIIR